MPLDAPHDPVAARAERLNRRYGDRSGHALLAGALGDPALGRVAVVSAFGAESVVLLHLVARLRPATPILFVDTEMLFAETLAYQQEVAETLGLEDVRTVSPAAGTEDPDGTLHQRDPDACCHLRKTRPLETALAPFDTWLTGRKRFQGDARAELGLFESDGAGRLKLNPLAHWTRTEVSDYIEAKELPRHPLAAKGYPSIGCRPCTSPVSDGEDPRAGRWRGSDKSECGIHFVDGRAVRGGPEGALE